MTSTKRWRSILDVSLALILALSLLAPVTSRAITDITLTWQRLEVRFTDLDLSSTGSVVRAVATASAGLEREQTHHGHLKDLELRWRNKQTVVPKAELQGVPQVRLRSLQIVRPDVRYSGGPTVRFEFKLAPNPDSEPNGYIRFEFEGGAYKRRYFEYEWQPGQTVKETKESGRRAVRKE
jgi:hypothetical protein